MNCRSLYKLLLLATAVLSQTTVKAGSTPESALVVNEIMPANIDMFIDPSFNYGSWIELYNPSDKDIDLCGWYISNDPLNRTQCPLGPRHRIVPAKGFLTLWFGNLDTYCPLQVEFKLENNYKDHSKRSTLLLTDSLGNLQIEKEYPFIPARISYARKTDGSDQWGYTGTPTPGASNNSCEYSSLQLEAPQVSEDSKLFTGTLYFSVDIPEGATLYYTKDGSLPTPDNPQVKVSSGSHSSESTKVYRFRLYKPGMLPSPVVTRSYICTTNQYSIPVLSVVTAPDNLYSDEYGIWVKGINGIAGNGQSSPCNWNRDWERPANVEFISPENEMIINQEVEISNSGRWSRAYDPNSFKMEAKSKYGYDNFFPFTPFKDKPYNKYNELKIRNGGNSYKARFRDAAVQKIVLLSGIDLDCQDYQPVQHYVNGTYKGVINMREPNNKGYGYANYGIDEDEIDFFKIDHNFGMSEHGMGYVQMRGSSDAWDEWVRLAKTAADDDSYNRICEIVDIQEFATYMALEFFIMNSDWPRNNVKGFRRTSDGRFRFIVFDLDNILGNSMPDGKNAFTNFDSQEDRSILVPLFHNMLENKTFRKLFTDCFCVLAGSVFDQKRCSAIIDELGEIATREMEFNSESPQSDISMLRSIGYSYVSSRINELRAWKYAKVSSTTPNTKTITTNPILPSARISINGITVPGNYFYGKVIYPASVSVEIPDGYRFKGWCNSLGRVVDANTTHKFKLADETLVATFIPDDEFRRPIRINEVSAGNDIFMDDNYKRHDWLELFNTTLKDYDASGMYLSDNPAKPQKYRIPNGTVIPAQGYLVVWCDKESGEQLHASFKLENKDTCHVVLTAADLSWADTLTYVEHLPYQSVGLYPDGARTSYVMNSPTIGKRNYMQTYDKEYKRFITAVKTVNVQKSSGSVFDLTGRAVLEMQPGQLYIKDGHKIYYRP